MGVRIKINGREYDRPEDLPPDLRRLYDEVLQRLGPELADRDGNGVPDIAEAGAAAGSPPGAPGRIVVDGQSYDSLEAMPAEARRKYEETLRLRLASVVPNLPAKTVFKVAYSLMKPRLSIVKRGSPSAQPSNAPIEPPSAEAGLRNGLILIAALVAALALAFVLLRGR